MKEEKPSLLEYLSFPFEISDSYGVDEEFQSLHWHQEFEICYIKKGSGKYLINGIVYPFSKGDIFMISNNDIHLCYDESDLIMQVVMFSQDIIHKDPAYILDFGKSSVLLSRSRKIDSKNCYNNKLSWLLSQMEDEYQSNQTGAELMIKSLLMQFIVLSVRALPDELDAISSFSVSSEVASLIRNIIDDIDKNFSERTDLTFLAEKYSISVPYLCSCFKKLTGYSLINFLIQRRLNEAKRLLISTDKSIIDISNECGFQSLSNFNHLFKNSVGCSPSVYRKSSFQ
ncbi:MAG: AraC family transcriptional regulator [Ruminococcus flavefaciens]|nr:AraC family transcriptional regulator [Ruminococcus flavefaciens]MCM1060045.1 AraC family transcriptional regulator [Eubacterium sp.]